jgi:hypothetical protein
VPIEEMFPKLLGIKNTHRYFPQLLKDNPFLSAEQIQDSKDLDLFGLTLEDHDQLVLNLPADEGSIKIFNRFSGFSLLDDLDQKRFKLSVEEVFLLPL